MPNNLFSFFKRGPLATRNFSQQQQATSAISKYAIAATLVAAPVAGFTISRLNSSSNRQTVQGTAYATSAVQTAAVAYATETPAVATLSRLDVNPSSPSEVIPESEAVLAQKKKLIVALVSDQAEIKNLLSQVNSCKSDSLKQTNGQSAYGYKFTSNPENLSFIRLLEELNTTHESQKNLQATLADCIKNHPKKEAKVECIQAPCPGDPSPGGGGRRTAGVSQ